MAYLLPSDTAYPVFSPIQLRMTKVIKGEFEKIKDVKVKDVPLTCDASLEVSTIESSIKRNGNMILFHNVDESRYEQMRRWNINANYDDANETNHRDNKSKELCEVHELPVKIEYDDITITRRKKACRAYQEIFQKNGTKDGR
ncbi:hypothetical protein Tco_0266474 [Tanacetum coccineum]